MALGPNKFAAHVKTDKTTKEVIAYAKVGVPHHDIAQLLYISTPTLLKHYREELDYGKAFGTSKVANKLFLMAMEGNLGACIFWLKCQAKWREGDTGEKVPSEIKVTGGLPD